MAIKSTVTLFRKSSTNKRVWNEVNQSEQNINLESYKNVDHLYQFAKSFNCKVVQRGSEYHVYYSSGMTKEIVTFEQVAEPKRKTAKEQGLKRGKEPRKSKVQKHIVLSNPLAKLSPYELSVLKGRIKKDIKKVRARNQLLKSSVNVEKSYLTAQLKAELEIVKKGKYMLKKIDDLKNYSYDYQ